MVEFTDGKDADALRTIGEVSEALGIKPHVLRYWEQQFSLLDPLKRGGGRRYYRPKDVALVERIDELVNAQGYTIKGAEAVLHSERSSKPGSPADERSIVDTRGSNLEADETERNIEPPPTEALAETIDRLKDIRARLRRAIDA